jgi:hypothetical protein
LSFTAYKLLFLVYRVIIRSPSVQVRCSARELLEKGEFWHAKVREALAEHK